jgi:hypothetical protein
VKSQQACSGIVFLLFVVGVRWRNQTPQVREIPEEERRGSFLAAHQGYRADAFDEHCQK